MLIPQLNRFIRGLAHSNGKGIFNEPRSIIRFLDGHGVERFGERIAEVRIFPISQSFIF